LNNKRELEGGGGEGVAIWVTYWGEG